MTRPSSALATCQAVGQWPAARHRHRSTASPQTPPDLSTETGSEAAEKTRLYSPHRVND
jgi:hypothetical protein